MSYYRKYRPKIIADLDLQHVSSELLSVLKNNSLQHAYLFVGPRGAGKTSAARILAKAVNCQVNEGKDEPCLTCESCLSIENQSAVDVIEIDAASHRGIDSIRDLKQMINLAPTILKKKVYIIDEVHMLTTEAFNALLKTLEEPPAHVMFFLCTTEDHKVPETIKSRCVRIGFEKATDEEVKRSLAKVIKGENIDIEEKALEHLSNLVDGSFREAHKLLEQLASRGEKITEKMLEEVYGSVGNEQVGLLLKLFLDGDAKLIMEKIEAFEKSNINIDDLMLRLINELRKEVRRALGVGNEKSKYQLERIKLVLESVSNAANKMKLALIKYVPLEIAAVDLELVKSEEPIKKQVKVESVKVKEKVIVEKPLEKLNVEETHEESVHHNFKVRDDVEMDEVREKWGKIIESVTPFNNSVAGLLRSCKPKEVSDKYLVIEAYYKFHKEQLEQESRRRILEKVLAEEIGLPAVRFVLGEKAMQASKVMAEHDNISVPKEDVDLAKAAEEVFGI